MKKKIFSIIIVLTLLLSQIMVIPTNSGFSQKAKTEVTKVSSNHQESQINERFPQENLTSRFNARYRRVFKGYKGRGEIIIENEGAESADIYINGNKLNLDEFFKSEMSNKKFDISKYTVDGNNSLKVLNISPKDSYINLKIPYPELIYGSPKDVDVLKSKLEKIDDFINSEVNYGFPGASLLIIKDGQIIKNSSYGYKKKYDKYELLDNPKPITNDTLFDLASNTKMFATNLSLMKLVSDGELNINDKVSKYLSEFKDRDSDVIKGKNNITIKDLLNHSAGFEPDPRYFDPEYAKELYSQDREKTLNILLKTPLQYEPGTKVIYSDVDYMLLGYIIETITNQRLDEYVEKNIYKPLGLTNTMYNPLEKSFNKEDVAATERNGNTRDGLVEFPNIRQYTLQGEVHDEKAYYSMDGVSGHAGLFSNAKDLGVLAQLILNEGGYGGFKLFDRNTLELFTKPSDIQSTYGLGWDRQADSQKIWEFGAYASNSTIGHTGWTGTVTCIDPENDLIIVLLTNKKHSPCPDGKFEGDKYQTGKYGTILSMVYEAVMEDEHKEDNQDIIQTAKDSIQVAEDTLDQTNLDIAKAMVSLIKDKKHQDIYINKIDEIQAIINEKEKLNLEGITSSLALKTIIDNSKGSGDNKAENKHNVKLGIDNIDSNLNIFRDKKVGLITNQTGINSDFISTIDVLYNKVNLVSLFAPEHGIRGNNQAGGTVGNEIDPKTGLPVYSLYGKTKKPTPEMLEDIDILTYDIQDVGTRFYTYIYTMAYAMEACAENDKTFVVFDRPNPLGDKVEGNILDEDYTSFIGRYPITQRYGLTSGEIAKLFNEEFNINCDLVVVPMKNWDRDMYYDETGLKTWIMPSPNMPTLDTAIVYPGTCIFEGTNVSEGRGTTRPFELIGAPWINSLDLSDKLNNIKIPGAVFRPASFKPTFSKYEGESCGGVQVIVTSRKDFEPVRTAITMLYTIRDMYPDDFEYLPAWNENYKPMIDLNTGNSYIRKGKYTLEEIFKILDKDEQKFEKIIKKYYIY